jgi:uncharacterized membrane protein (DUF4010 family)
MDWTAHLALRALRVTRGILGIKVYKVIKAFPATTVRTAHLALRVHPEQRVTREIRGMLVQRETLGIKVIPAPTK